MTNPSSERKTASYYVVFNPVSGPGAPGDKLIEIESALESLSDLTVRLTKPDLSAEHIAKEAVAAGADVVIAVGGDGTVSGVASALVDTDVELGIIPAGTANSFASALDIPENLSAACDIIKTGQRRRVDTARCNDRLMLLVACIGFEAKLLEQMEREEKSRFGKLAIVTNSLKQLREIEQFDTQLETPDRQWHEPATAVTIANAATVDMVLAQGPAAIAADDGKLSITLATPEHQWGVLKSAAHLFLSALLNRDVNNDTVHSWKASDVKVDTDPAQAVFVDGEPAGKTPLTIECHPRSLTVITPARPENKST